MKIYLRCDFDDMTIEMSHSISTQKLKLASHPMAILNSMFGNLAGDFLQKIKVKLSEALKNAN